MWGKKKRLKEAQEREKRRVKRCNEILEGIALDLGYIARKVISREALQDLIDDGMEPEDLLWYVITEIEKTPGLTLGYHYFGEELPHVDVKLLPEFKEKHIYVIGKTGAGKTNFLRNLMFQELKEGNGFGVISPELELLTEELLPYIPEERTDDVIYVNPADKERPVPFNPLAVEEGEDIDRKVDDLLVIFQRALGEAGAQMLPILRNSFYALCEREGVTLLDMYRLLSRKNPSFREEVIRTTKNPTVARFLKEDYPLMRKTAHLPITNRLDSFVGVEIIRNVLCQPQSSFSFREAMNRGKILLFNLSDGILGEENSQLMGQLVVSKFQQALMSRVSIPKRKRRPFTLFIDEFQTFTSAATEGYEKILSRARKYKMILVLAHQQTKQIPDHLLKEILGNVATIVSFNISQADAQKISKEFIDKNIFGEIAKLEPEELLALDVGQAFCRIGKNSFKMKTFLADQHPDFARAKEVIEASRKNYGLEPVSEVSRQRGKIFAEEGPKDEEKTFLEFVAGNPDQTVSKVYRTLNLSVWKGNKIRDSLKRGGLIEQIETRLGKKGRAAKFFIPTMKGFELLGRDAPSGRGGSVHRHIQKLIEEEAILKGYTAERERELPGGGAVDVHLEKEGKIVAVEVSITSNPDREIANISKCLEAGYSKVFCLFLDGETMEGTKDKMKEFFSENDLWKVNLLSLKKVGSFL